jgi:hypothetical protein
MRTAQEEASVAGVFLPPESLRQGWVLLAQRFLAHTVRQAVEYDGHRNAGATDPGVFDAICAEAIASYDKIIGLDLSDVSHEICRVPELSGAARQDILSSCDEAPGRRR